MKAWLRIPLQLLLLGVLGLVVVVAVITGGYYYVEPGVPRAEQLRAYRLQLPLRIVSRDDQLIDLYGEQWRAPVTFEDVPERVVQAFLAAEDDQFFEHSGIDYAGIARGAWLAVTRPGQRVPGGSTITQQVSRSSELVSRERTLVRKFKEVILAFQIEREFTKTEILELFLNTTFFGNRAYGVATAARTYFNKDLDQLTLGEIASLAGVPQRPSENNPFNGPVATARRKVYVLGRMLELGHIDRAEREAALAEPVVAQLYSLETELEANDVSGMAYFWCLEKFGKARCDTAGLKITTTIDSRLQLAANQGLRNQLESYDRDKGWRGPIGRVDLAALSASAAMNEDADAEDLAELELELAIEIEPESEPEPEPEPESDAEDVAGGVGVERGGNDGDGNEAPAPGSYSTLALETLLGAYEDVAGTEAAIVMAVGDESAVVYLRRSGQASVGFDAVSWARRYVSVNELGSAPVVVGDVLTAGDIVRFRRRADGALELAQIPEVQGAMVAVDPLDGAVVALIGGYNQKQDDFNRVTVALRQPGSAFKPFFYLAALANGYTLSTIVNDVCVTYYDETLERMHCVENFGRYNGLVRLRFALKESLNAAADRILRDIGAGTAANFIRRFGFGPEALPRNNNLALGGGSTTPLDMAGAYSILANDGYAVGILNDETGRMTPYFIDKVENANGELIWESSLSVARVCSEPADTDNSGETVQLQLIERSGDLFPSPPCAERVESPQRIFLIKDVLREVITETSGARAGNAFEARKDNSSRRLTDLAGKTGTTNGPRDAWFAGFNPDIVAIVRVGFDDDARVLGNTSQGGRTAIPAWIDFMKVALDGIPVREIVRPPGIVDLLINRDTGLIAADCNRNANTMREYFLIENQPERESSANCYSPGGLTPDPDSGAVPGEGAGSIFQ